MHYGTWENERVDILVLSAKINSTNSTILPLEKLSKQKQTNKQFWGNIIKPSERLSA